MWNLSIPLSCCKSNEKITIKVKSQCFERPLVIHIDDENEHVEQLKEILNKLIENKKDNIINI